MPEVWGSAHHIPHFIISRRRVVLSLVGARRRSAARLQVGQCVQQPNSEWYSVRQGFQPSHRAERPRLGCSGRADRIGWVRSRSNLGHGARGTSAGQAGTSPRDGNKIGGHVRGFVPDRCLGYDVCDEGDRHTRGGRQDDVLPIDRQESTARPGRRVPDGSDARARREGAVVEG